MFSYYLYIHISFIIISGVVSAAPDQSLLPETLPDPETHALPVFLEEPPPAVFVSRTHSARLRCKAAHATHLTFSCNDQTMNKTRLLNETEEGSNRYRYRTVSLEVKLGQVTQFLGDFSCHCVANSSRGQVESSAVNLREASKF
jgi:hypothetical protein